MSSDTAPVESAVATRPAIHWPALLSIFLVAVCLRTAITAVGPVLDRIGDGTGLSETWLGLLGALPLLAFAGVSPLVRGAARRAGTERLIGLALAGLAVGVAVRSVPSLATLWIGTVMLGAGIAVGNVLLPAVVRRDHPARTALITGSYSAVMGTAASIASGVSLPLTLAFGGSWRWSLAVWALPAVVAAGVWLVRPPIPPGTESAPPPTTTPTPARPAVWRSALAWRLTVFMGLQSTGFYVLVSWLPAILTTRNVSASAAGWYLFAFQVAGVLSGLAVPLILRRLERHVAAAVSTLPMIVAVLGLALLPAGAPGWVVLAGLGTGATLVMALSLFSLDAEDPGHAAALSGMAQSLGYLVAAGGPIGAGALREATGSWTPALIGVAVLGVVQAGAVIVGRRPDAKVNPRAAART